MSEDRPRKLAPWKRLLGVLALTAIVVAGTVGGYFLTDRGSPAAAPEQVEAPLLLSSIFWLVLGFLFSGAGIFTYVVVLVTNAFTFDFSKPFWSSQKVKLWVFNVAVMVLAAMGLGFFARAVLGPILDRLGLPMPLPDVLPIIGALVLVQAMMMWFNLWAPLEKSGVRRRLASYGVAERDLDGGWLVGISEPAKSSFKKMTSVEEDLGMLWFRGDQLIYRGDTQDFEMQRDDLLEVERAADPGSVQAYGGAVDVILRFRDEAGSQRRVRLHALGYWHTGAVKEALEALAVRLNAWRRPLPSAAAPMAI